MSPQDPTDESVGYFHSSARGLLTFPLLSFNCFSLTVSFNCTSLSNAATVQTVTRLIVLSKLISLDIGPGLS